jgi:hypothetical protein
VAKHDKGWHGIFLSPRGDLVNLGFKPVIVDVCAGAASTVNEPDRCIVSCQILNFLSTSSEKLLKRKYSVRDSFRFP